MDKLNNNKLSNKPNNKLKNKIIIAMLSFLIGCGPSLINNNFYNNPKDNPKNNIKDLRNSRIDDLNRILLGRFDDTKGNIISLYSNGNILYALIKDYNQNKAFDEGDTLTVSSLKIKDNSSSRITYELTSLDKIISIEISEINKKDYYMPVDSLQYQNYIRMLKEFLK